jgi:hypothetical protein
MSEELGGFGVGGGGGVGGTVSVGGGGGVGGTVSVGGGSVVGGGGSVVCAGVAALPSTEDEAMANPDANPSRAQTARRPTATARVPRFTLAV